MELYSISKFKDSWFILIEIPTVKVHAERKTGFLNSNIFTSSFWNCWKKSIYFNQIFAQRTLNHLFTLWYLKQNGCIVCSFNTKKTKISILFVHFSGLLFNHRAYLGFDRFSFSRSKINDFSQSFSTKTCLV